MPRLIVTSDDLYESCCVIKMIDGTLCDFLWEK